MEAQNPKIVELSFRILESIIMATEFHDKKEIEQFANISAEKAESGEYPEEIKLAYKEAYNRVVSLSFEQIKELKDILQD